MPKHSAKEPKRKLHKAIKKRKPRSFTLIELVVGIGVIAVLSIIVILTINPAELLRRSRDSARASDLGTIGTAMGLYRVDFGNTGTGLASVLYVSVPDTSPTCDNLGLPPLPSGWNYNCVTKESLRKPDGNGWIPVNFTKVSSGSPLAALPVDPINTTSSGEYYTYVASADDWKVTSNMESQKYIQQLSQGSGGSGSGGLGGRFRSDPIRRG